MREKKVNEKTIRKYLEFLGDVKSRAFPNTNNLTLQHLIKLTSINKSISTALIKLGIIKIDKDDKYKWEWLTSNPDKNMVLEILDSLLHANKKITNVPLLPEFATVISLLKEISDKMGSNTGETDNPSEGLKKAKTKILFDNQLLDPTYLNILAAITTGVYTGVNRTDSSNTMINRTNEFIVEAADNLYKRAKQPKQ